MARERKISLTTAIVLIFLMLSSLVGAAEEKRSLVLENFDQLNRKMTDSGSVWYGYGNIRLRMGATYISSDSMIWLRDKNVIHFFGRVDAFDSAQHIWAEQLSYYNQDSVFMARKNVTMIQYLDSIKTESQSAEYNRKAGVVYLEGEPHLYLNYPDSARMVAIVADHLTFYTEGRNAEAEGNVVITQQNTRATCGCAEFSQSENMLTLKDEPHAVQDSSDITGTLMKIQFAGGTVNEIDVYEDAQADFVEAADSTTGEYSGNSKLSGDNIKFYFKDDQIRKIAAMGAARSEYYPSMEDTTGAGKNLVSGDSIFIYVRDRRINKVEIKGGAEGEYITQKDEAKSISKEPPPAAPADTVLTDSIKTELTETAPEDSSLIALTDSSLTADSLAPAGPAEDTIHYRGDYLEFFASNRMIRITGNAAVRQGQVSLTADKVDYDVPGRVVLAQARVDTVDTNVNITPLALKDGSEEIFGSKLVFNVDTKKGKIEGATTQFESSYYRGHDLFKENEKVFYVENGLLTSCDLEEPHFHFSSKRMKLIQNDRVIARPVTLYIETIPILTIPYYIFPLKRGRHSGILPIKLGNFEKGNRFIGNLGYYWAASDYWDIQSSLDFQENTGITINNIFRYNKRYDFAGNLYASYSRDRKEYAYSEYRRDRWRIYGNHAQTLPYEIDFKASGEFVSDKNYNTDFLTDPEERRNRNIISKANFNKRFGGSSLSLSFSHTNNLDANTRNSSVPTGSFTMPSFHPFGSGTEVDGKTVQKWYQNFYVGYRNNFGFLDSQGRKTTADTLADSTIIVYDSRTWKDYGYVDHSMSVTAAQRILKYVSVSPSVSLGETWYYILKSDQAEAAGIPADQPYRRGSISAGVSSNTNLYGTFPVNLMGLMALRHVMSPSVSFGWSPAITKNNLVRNYTGRGGGGGAQKRVSFGLQNLFQAKVKKGETEKKIDLLQVSSSLSYNFEATERKFSNLSTSLSSTLLNNINVRGNLSHDLYDRDNNLHFFSPSLNSFSVSGSFQARGSVADDYVREALNPDNVFDTLSMLTQGAGPSDLGTGGAGGEGTNWNLNLSYYYSELKSFGVTTSRTHWVQYTFNMNLTKSWSMKYSQKYDFIRHQSIDKIVDLYRKMHCWEAHFYWIPTGSRQGYYFKINVISIPDIKFEKSESGLRGALFNR